MTVRDSTKFQEPTGQSFQNPTPEPSNQTLAFLLVNIYDDLSDLLASSEFTQKAIESLMEQSPEHSPEFVQGACQTFSWLHGRGKGLKDRLKVAIHTASLAAEIPPTSE